jgi:hypothetical protein
MHCFLNSKIIVSTDASSNTLSGSLIIVEISSTTKSRILLYDELTRIEFGFMNER